MANVRKSSVSRVATVLVLLPLVALIWYGAPFVLPVWRWRNIDFQAIASKTGIPESELRTEFTMVVHYNPRTSGGTAIDPSPYQIVECTPTWKSLDPKNMNEDRPPLLVRCTLINDGDGKPINALFIHGASEERFFHITAWRFPPGSFGMNDKRPVVVYSNQHLADFNYGVPKNAQIVKWENDDHFRGREDYFGQ